MIQVSKSVHFSVTKKKRKKLVACHANFSERSFIGYIFSTIFRLKDNISQRVFDKLGCNDHSICTFAEVYKNSLNIFKLVVVISIVN